MLASIVTPTACFDTLRICGRANDWPPLDDVMSTNSSWISTTLRRGCLGIAITLPASAIGLASALTLEHAMTAALSEQRVDLTVQI